MREWATFFVRVMVKTSPLGVGFIIVGFRRAYYTRRFRRLVTNIDYIAIKAVFSCEYFWHDVLLISFYV